MDAWRVWKRLLWKEWRESGIVLAVGLALALLLIPNRHREWALYAGMGVIGLVFILWTAYHAQEDDDCPRLMLPLAPHTRWLMRHLLPLPVPVFLAACIAVAFFTKEIAAGQWPAVFHATLLFMLGLYLLTAAVTTVYTAIPGILAGAVFLITFFEPQSIREGISSFKYHIITMLGMLLVWSVFRWRRWLVGGRVMVALGLLAVTLGPQITDQVKHAMNNASADAWGIYFMPWSDKALLSAGWGRENGMYSSFKVRSQDHTFQQTFTSQEDTLPLDFLPDGRLLIAHQAHRSRDVQILLWQPHTPQADARMVARFAMPSGILRRAVRAFARPDGRCLLLLTESGLKTGCDIWALDLTHGTAALALPAAGYYRAGMSGEDMYLLHIGWTADNRAMLSLIREDLIEINLSTLRGRKLLFTAQEDAR